ncbi:MAG: YbjN domain-containing protein [Pseudomonadota bacterium]
MTQTFIKAALLALALAMPWAAQAQADGDARMVTASNPQTVVEALQSAGYKAKLTVDNSGDPLVETSMSGWNVSVVFYDCSNNKNCESVQFYAIFDRPEPLPAALAVGWSARKRFGAVGLDEEGDPFIFWDVVTGTEGIPYAVFESVISRYEFAVADFAKMVFE